MHKNVNYDELGKLHAIIAWYVMYTYFFNTIQLHSSLKVKGINR